MRFFSDPIVRRYVLIYAGAIFTTLSGCAMLRL